MPPGKPATASIGADRLARLERVSLLAWPPAALEVVDGWQLRRDADSSKRCNACATSFPYAGRKVETSIARVVERYASFGQTALFHLTSASQPEGLASALAEAGFERFGDVQVMTQPLAGLELPVSGSVQLEGRPTPLAMEALLDPRTPAALRSARAALFGRAKVPMALAVAMVDGQPAGGGYVAIADKIAFLAAIRVHAASRGQGLGRAVLNRMLGWAAAMGADEAMLQVESDNARARNLYARAGFFNAYEYWYCRPA